MKHYYLKALTLLSCLIFGITAHAHDFEAKNSDGVTIYYEITSSTDKTCEVTFRGSSYSSYSYEYNGNITIPKSVTYNGTTYSVTSIGYSAFESCTGLTSVTIPNSVTSIGNYAFSDCTSLTSITIGNSVTSISSGAFSDCTGLTSVTIPNSVTSIGDYAFNGCTSLTSITIPNSVTSIGKYAFSYCTRMTSVTIPNSVTSIGNYAFNGCTRMTSVTIPNSVTSIGNYAFSGCTGLTSVTIGNSVTSIGSSAFYNCTGLTSVTIGNSVTSIGSSAFNGCTGLTSVTIGNSVTSIGSSAFYNCTGLTSITIPESVTSISSGAFSGCTGLTSITIPESVTSISSGAFSGCTSLTSVTIGNSVTSIGSSAFYNCTGLTSVTIGNSVTSIGSSAFYNCTGLTSVNISDLEAWCKIGFGGYEANPLYYAKKLYLNGELLTELVIPDSITEIKIYAFYGCTGLTSITIPESVTNISSGAFSGCTGLCSIKMNASTQTKMNFNITNNTEYEFYIKSNKTYTTKDNTIEIPELAPGKTYSFEYGLIINNNNCYISYSSKYTTKSLSPKLEIGDGVVGIKAKGSYTEGEATILGTMLSFQEKPTEYDNLNEKTFNLEPNRNYTVYYSVNTKEGGVYSASKTFTTGALTWNDEEYQATSTTSARLMTATNCDATEGTGFEWRRYGAPENLKPNAVACPVVDGMLIGSLRNLNSEAYYEFRPYYTSSSGNTYYGEWTALFTGDANVYFEPEVRTYEDVVVTTNNVTLKGYALAGTDDIISQGFEYWKSAVQPASLTASGATMKVEATGITMSTTIGDLEYGTTYCYRAYATTSKGTIYGDTVEFTTEKDLSGVESVIAEEDETIEYYNLQGVRVVNPERGLYIKRQGGKTRKVIL